MALCDDFDGRGTTQFHNESIYQNVVESTPQSSSNLQQSSPGRRSLCPTENDTSIVRSADLKPESNAAATQSEDPPPSCNSEAAVLDSKEAASKKAHSSIISQIISWIKPTKFSVNTTAALIVLGFTILSFRLSKSQTDIAVKSYRLGVYKDCQDRPVSLARDL